MSNMALANKMIWILELLLCAVPLSMASQINATVDQSVLLPCSIPRPVPPLKETRIYWQTAENSDGHASVLYFINMGVKEPQHQAPQYQNRTALDLSQAAAGNLSLELKEVTEADNQTTLCCFHSISKLNPKEVSCVTLMVLQKPYVESPDSQSFPGWATGLLIVALLLVLVFVAVVLKVLQGWTGRRDRRDPGVNLDEDAGELDHVTADGTADATANGTVNGTANGTANGTTNGTANGTADGTADATTNGTANGTVNGTANGTANNTANDKEPQSDTPLMTGHS